MKFRFNDEKNAKLLKERGVGFEEVIQEIRNGNLLEDIEHHNLTNYPNQKIMQVKILDNVYVAPYVIEKDGTFFLKTLYPSRKATKKYLSRKKNIQEECVIS